MEPKLAILVVEDDALIAENLRLTLQDLGYATPPACHTYVQAEAALTRPGGVAADLVLLDIHLGSADPARTGLALARHLGGPAAPPFVFLTAYADLDTIRHATRLQPSGYLIKPVNGPTLFAAIQTALERHRTHAPAPLPAPAEDVPAPDYFFVKIGERTHKLRWAEVAALEAGKNYVTLRTAAYRTGYPLRGSLAYVLDQLLPETLRAHFLRVNRRTFLNAAYITGYDDEFVYCGPDRYENAGTALRQLQELRLK